MVMSSRQTHTDTQTDHGTNIGNNRPRLCTLCMQYGLSDKKRIVTSATDMLATDRIATPPVHYSRSVGRMSFPWWIHYGPSCSLDSHQYVPEREKLVDRQELSWTTHWCQPPRPLILQYHDTIRYDMIRCSILTCAQSYEESWTFVGMTFSEMSTSVALPTSHHFHLSLSPVVSLSLGVLHEWMRTQMLLLAIFKPPPDNWRRPPGQPLTIWMKNIHDDLSSLDLRDI